jgi:uncharacterized protein (DUF1778 family)
MVSTTRDSRLELRLASDEKAIIERAAALSGSNTTDFVRSIMLTAARETVRMHEVIKLTADGSRVSVEAIIDPPEPNEHLRALARESGVILER